MEENRTIRVGDASIGLAHEPFIIAEMSGNHNGSLERALKIVDAAAASGVHALKLQTYTPETMTLDINEGEFFIDDPKSLWHGRSLFDLYGEAQTPWEWHKTIFERCREHNMIGFSTPFDASAVDFLEELDIPIYKIASFENTDIPLIKRVAKTGKPIIISTGMATVEELFYSVRAAKDNGCKDLILLKCTSSYPSTPESTNILTVPHMRELFNCEVGLSDHTMGVGAACCGIALGATVIEKHFTIKRSEGGVDAAFSMEPAEMALLRTESKHAWQAKGMVSYGPEEREKASLVFRRSLYIVKDMSEGDILTAENLRTIRPGFGLPPRFYDKLLGKKVKKAIKRGTPVTWELV
jgi:pseudaminic acid synthase